MTITVTFDTPEELAAALGTAAPLDGGPLDAGTIEWACEVLATLNFSDLEDAALDDCPPGGGKGSTTAAVVRQCVAQLTEAARAGR